ncbi:hypothetical protein ACHAW5_007333, partial [Stephanodiscus triporus]
AHREGSDYPQAPTIPHNNSSPGDTSAPRPSRASPVPPIESRAWGIADMALPPPPDNDNARRGDRAEYRLVTKYGTTSKWWKHFKVYHAQHYREDIGCKNIALCTLCFNEINVAKGITGLSSHVQRHHVDVYNRMEFPNLYRVDEIVSSSENRSNEVAASVNNSPSVGIVDLIGAVKLPNKNKRNANVLAATTAWVIEENQPLTAVEKPSFRRMMSTIDPFYPKTTTKAVRNDISYLGIVSWEALKRELKGKYFSLTTDHWTSPNDETYSCLTVHWIENGMMHRAVLTFEVFSGTTTGHALGEDFVRVFNLYEFDLKYVVAVVTDTTGNMNTFGEYLRQRDQYEILEDVEKLLEPTAVAQKYLEGEKYPTISLVPFFLHSIRRQYEDMANDDSKSGPVVNLAGVLLKDFEKRYLTRSQPVFSTEIRRAHGRYEGLPADTIIASALDPRTKNLRPFIPDSEHDYIWKELLNLMIQLKIANAPITSVATATAVDSLSHCPLQRARLDGGAGTRGMFDELIVSNQRQDEAVTSQALSVHIQESMRRSCSDELERYRFTEVSLPMFCLGTGDEEQFSDPLMWWEARKIAYPTLYVLAQRYLSIPATSAPSERLWSLASRIVTIRRARLESSLIGDLMFIKENSLILDKHFYDITGETRILPKVYPAGDGDKDNKSGDDVINVD